MTKTVLRIDTSARKTESASRELADLVIERLAPTKVITRDLANPLPLIDETWVGANFTPPADRTAEQTAALELSETLVAEIKEADTVVIGLPVYNFSVPAVFKAWVDLVARAGVTFAYSEAGPKGLLEGKRAIVIVASGGVKLGSEADFSSAYVRFVLGFMGITDVEFVAAEGMAVDPAAAMAAANSAVEALTV